jgi:hypothetical protein
VSRGSWLGFALTLVGLLSVTGVIRKMIVVGKTASCGAGLDQRVAWREPPG